MVRVINIFFKLMAKSGGGDAVYGLGVIGALVFYLQNANTLGEGLIGVVKSLIWPAMVVYRLLGYLNM